MDTTSQLVAGALGLYHVAPLVRACGRIWSEREVKRSEVVRKETGERRDVRLRVGGGKWWKDLGGAKVHLLVHGLALGALGSLALGAGKGSC